MFLGASRVVLFQSIGYDQDVMKKLSDCQELIREQYEWDAREINYLDSRWLSR